MEEGSFSGSITLKGILIPVRLQRFKVYFAEMETASEEVLYEPGFTFSAGVLTSDEHGPCWIPDNENAEYDSGFVLHMGNCGLCLVPEDHSGKTFRRIGMCTYRDANLPRTLGQSFNYRGIFGNGRPKREWIDKNRVITIV